MTLEDAFIITNTLSMYELANYLTANGEPITRSAIAQWGGVVPDSSIPKILRASKTYHKALRAASNES